MKQYLNITTVDGTRIAPVDVITFGSPCQDLSVAGRREGLEGERSHLFYEAVRIVKEMRQKTDGAYPRFAVWENVPGAYSSSKGKDFAAVLDALVAVAEPEAPDVPVPTEGWSAAGHLRSDMGGGWSIAWRTFNAEHWGVPQRRNRILLVADFTGERAGEILFKPDSVSRDFETVPTEREEPPSNAPRGAGRASEFFEAYQHHGYRQSHHAGTLTAGQNNTIRGDTGLVATFESNGFGGYKEGCGTLRASGGDLGGGSENLVCFAGVASTLRAGAGAPKHDADVVGRLVGQKEPAYCIQGSMIGRAEENGPQGDGINENKSFTLTAADRHAVCYNLCSHSSNSMKSNNPDSGIYKADKTRTLDLNGGNPSCNQGGTMVLFENHRERCGYAGPLDICPTMRARWGTGGDNIPYVLSVDTSHASEGARVDEIAPALQARDYKGGKNVLCSDAEEETCLRVRRLTPTECARLQGFPDWWASLPTIEDMSDEDHQFWQEALEGWAEIEGKTYKPKTKPQMITWYNKLHTDSAEYKMWGNGVALPMVREVMRGLANQGAETMGSLFDGSGGFPLASYLEGMTPLWSSEVQPYPIAVTRERFKFVGRQEEQP